MKLINAVIVFAIIAALIAATAAALRLPQLAIYIPVIAIGLALALQKQIANFFGYFSITFSRIYGKGDRIRIGDTKGDVQRVGLIHTILEEVGEGDKLGGELTGRLIHMPNLLVLDQPVLNYSQDYSVTHKRIYSSYIFDEVRIALSTDSDVQAAIKLLDDIVRSEDADHITEARRIFGDEYPNFLDEATHKDRILIHIEPQHIWVKGKFVVPFQERNQSRSRILLRFLEAIDKTASIKLA